MKEYKKLWEKINFKNKVRIGILLILMVISAITELVSIGAVIPFLSVLVSPENIYNSEIFSNYNKYFGIKNSDELILPITIFFAGMAIITGLVRLTVMWLQNSVSISIGSELSLEVYRLTLYKPYQSHISRHSSVIHTGIQKAMYLVDNLIQPTLTIISAIIILIFVVTGLIIIYPKIGIIIILTFLIVYGLIIKIVKDQLKNKSKIVANMQTKTTKTVQEGLGGIREIILQGTQEIFIKIFKETFFPMQKASGQISVIGQSPRYLIESLGMVIIAIMAYQLLKESNDNIYIVVPYLGAIALAAQRLLPLMQQIYNAIVKIKGTSESINDAINLISDENYNIYKLKYEKLQFKEKIELVNIYFKYENKNEWILKDINILIKKGEVIGLIGKTGSGKSTLIDILMCLLENQRGQIKIDGKIINDRKLINSFQKNITHVPQNIFLSNSTVAENIAFGVEKNKINYDLINKAIKQAQLDEVINKWPNKYETMIGENGIMLSGGEKQRIGIARALYQTNDILILDEATSAMDSETELKVMNEINKLNPDMTIIIIAHRLNTLRNCDKIIEIDSGKIKDIHKYDDIKK